MDMNFINTLQTYINAENEDYIFYSELAKHAPEEEYRNLLTEIAEEEKGHADSFTNIFRMLAGRDPVLSVSPVAVNGDFYEILRDRLMDETRDYKKYSEHYAVMPQNNTIRNAFFRAMTDENSHALKLLYMLAG